MPTFMDEDLADFFEQAPIALHLVGPDGTILRANRAELDLLGYSADEYVGRNIAEFHVDGEVICDILRRLTDGETLHSYEARLRHKNGEIRYVLITSNVRREDGEFIHTRCFTRDITDRKRAEEARAQAKAMAQLAAHLQIAREDERRLLARQLHDELIAGLTAAAMDLHNVQVELAERSDPLAEKIGMVMRLLSASVQVKRRIIESLMPTMLHELGLGAALRQMAQRFTAKTGIACNTEIAAEVPMDEELALVLYRIAQDALDSAAGDQGATRATMVLAQHDGHAVLTVRDDRRPKPDHCAPALPLYQLQGCEQLLAAWGGALSVHRNAAGGPVVEAVAPLGGARVMQ
ncbi:MAG: PAS domain S-box protein [Casimicrobiaceae bacterium]